MIEYRRQGPRNFYKIDGRNVMHVMNKGQASAIEVLIDTDMGDYYCIDTDVYKVIPESEFKEQFDLAMERIVNNKI